MKDYIAKLRQKPEHVRKRIAVGTTGGITALVGLIWIGTMAATGAFSLATSANTTSKLTTTNDSSNSFALDGTNAQTNFSQLVGAVGAAAGATTSKPSLKIIDGQTSSSFQSATPQSATILPF